MDEAVGRFFAGQTYHFLDDRGAVEDLEGDEEDFPVLTPKTVVEMVGRNRDKLADFNKHLRAMLHSMKHHGHLFNELGGDAIDDKVVKKIDGAVSVSPACIACVRDSHMLSGHRG